MLKNGAEVLLFMAIAAVFVFLLYRSGLMTTKSICAVSFMFLPGKNGDQAKINSCNGWVRHRAPFQESRVYELGFQAELAKGDVAVSVLDEDKNEVVRLNQWMPTGRIGVDGRKRYHIRWEFKGATGKCELSW